MGAGGAQQENNVGGVPMRNDNDRTSVIFFSPREGDGGRKGASVVWYYFVLISCLALLGLH